MPAWPERPSTVIVGSRLPRQAIQTSRSPGSGTIAPSARSSRAIARPPGARRLLLRDRVHDQVALEADAEPGEHLGGERHARDAALHVARPAAVHATVRDDGRERVVRPALARLDRDDVDVAVEQQRTPSTGAREARSQLRTALEGEAVGHHRMAGERRDVGLPDAHVGARALEALCEVALQRELLAGRVARLVRRRVEADQRAQQLDEVVPATLDLVAHRLLGGRQRHRALTPRS